MLWACRNRFAKGTGTNPMFRAASVFVPQFVVLRWLRRSITFFFGFAWWLKFRSGLGMLSLFLFVGSKSNASAFFWLCFRMAWVFLGVPNATQWLRHVFIVFFMGLDFIGFRGSKSNVSRFLRLQFRNGLDAKPAGALPFRMRSRRSFLRLCLVAAVSQWLGHDFMVFRGSKRNVSRFLRLHSCNGLDAKPAGALPFRMRSSFLGLCLVAAVSQWLGHDFIVFRGSKSNVSRFLRLQFRNGLDAKPAGALPFRMRSRRSFLRLCLVAEVSQWLGHDFIVFRGSKRLWSNGGGLDDGDSSTNLAAVRVFRRRESMEHRVWTVYCSFLERSVGNVRHFFWLLFRMT